MTDFSRLVFSEWAPEGATLVEASAGTGKTYNIQNAYLRLVLEQGLTVQQILVVTFTEAATRELRDRLRQVLMDGRRALEGRDPEPDDRIRQAIEQARCRSAAADAELARRVRTALMDFDGAAIFTIHGFCNRVLERHAFECGHDPDAELMPEHSRIIREACQDWWRRHAYGERGEPDPFPSLEALVQLVTETSRHPDARLKGSALPSEPVFADFLSAAQAAWAEIGNLQGKAAWSGGGGLRAKAKGPVVEISPLRNAIAAHGAVVAEWLNTHPVRNPEAPEKDFADAAAYVLETVRNLPETGDAKPFTKCLKALAAQADDQATMAARAGIAAKLADDVRQRIRDRSALTYDAMLYNVRQVLRDASAGPRLKAVLREEFRAALIDEFQDTDPVQFGIFSAIFAADVPDAPPLLFVGDPKQAIYGFRGGDVFTYFHAKDGIPEDRRHSLGTNYRSETQLVAAVNELFQDDDPGSTFRAGRNIPYPGDLQAHGTRPEKTIRIGEQPDPHPLHVWTYETRPGDSTSAEGPLARRILSDVAREIVRLLADDTLRYPGDPPRRLRAADIAVLVMTHQEAATVQQELIRCGVNAVRQATGNVFDTEEAGQLALVMQALLSPGKAAHLRGALSAAFIPCPLAAIERFHRDDALDGESPGGPEDDAAVPGAQKPRTLDEWLELFREAGQLWQTHSFMMAFQFLSRALGIRAHVAGQPDGPRRMAALLHLVELAHQAARGQKLGPVALLRWFTQQLQEDRRDESGVEDAAKTRLADDDDAVRIMTIFKSKGLQFPVVFLPTLWRRKADARRPRDIVLKYHEDHHQLVLDLDTGSASGKEAARLEHFEEDIRLAYVGITRAINRVVLAEVQDDGITPGTHALAHLLSRWRARQPLPPGTGDPPPNPLALGHVQVFRPPPDLSGVTRKAPDALLPLPPPPPAPKVDKDHGRASFTSLAAHAAGRPEAPAGTTSLPDGVDRDQAENLAAWPPEIPAPDDPILAIPGGAKLGTGWHQIFERIDFQAGANAIARTVDDTLDQHRICPRPADDLPEALKIRLAAQRQSVHEMVRKVLAAPLDAGHGSFALREIPLSARRSELEFHFSLQTAARRRVGDLAGILDAHWTSPARDPGFIEALRLQSAGLPLGFMTGSIDLVFERAGRFHLADWKSNQITRQAAGFDAAGLAAEMRRHSYYLQYMIYTAALHGFLARHLEGYDYDRHVGGVFYLFLRGMGAAAQAPGRGIFTDRLPRPLVEALSDFLGGGAP